MKKIVCEMCESTNFAKVDGFFVCQKCGMKYSPEDAKKMMVEVEEETVETPAPAPIPPVVEQPQVDNADRVANYLTIAKNALKSSNHKEAEEYCNKILELDANNWEAWLVKSQAAGWQTTIARPRIDEAYSCLANAIGMVPIDLINILIVECRSILRDLLIARGVLQLGHLRKFPKVEGIRDYANLKVSLLQQVISLQIVYATRVNSYNADKAEADQIELTTMPDSGLLKVLDEKHGECAAGIWYDMWMDYTKDNYPSDYCFKNCMEPALVAIQLMDMLIPKESEKVAPEDVSRIIGYCKEICDMRSRFACLKGYTVSFSDGIERHNVTSEINSYEKATQAIEIKKMREYVARLKPGTEIPETDLEKKLQAIRAEREAKAARNSFGCQFLFGVIAVVLFYGVRRLIMNMFLWRYSLLMSDTEIKVLYASFGIIFTLFCVLVGLVGYRFVAPKKKKVKILPLILIPIILYYVLNMVDLPELFDLPSQCMLVLYWFVAFFAFLVADRTGKLLGKKTGIE